MFVLSSLFPGSAVQDSNPGNSATWVFSWCFGDSPGCLVIQYVDLAGPKFTEIYLPLPPKCWDFGVCYCAWPVPPIFKLCLPTSISIIKTVCHRSTVQPNLDYCSVNFLFQVILVKIVILAQSKLTTTTGLWITGEQMGIEPFLNCL